MLRVNINGASHSCAAGTILSALRTAGVRVPTLCDDPRLAPIGGCRLCPYMKLNSLEKIRDALKHPRPEQIITLDETIRRRAARCIERMFELTPATS